MKFWLTTQEIADLDLPGLPDTKRGVAGFADRAGWAARKLLCRRRTGAGGGLEYHLDLLPPEARQAYVGRHVGDAVPFAVAEVAEAEPAADHLRDSAAEARDARLAILAAADSFQLRSGAPRRHADLRFVAEVQAGNVELPDWVRASARKLSLRTLLRWRAAVASGCTTALAVDRGAARRGGGVLDTAEGGEVRLYTLALITKQPFLSADHVRSMLLGRFGQTLTVTNAQGVVRTVPMPPIRTVQDALKRWKASERVLLTALTDPDGFKSRFQVSGANTDRSVRRLNELWQIDASPVDALCVDGRHSVYVAIDIYSRRTVLYVSRTPRAEAVGLMLRRAILAWGVPERIKTDNGSDFVAKSIQRLLASLGIERELSPAFTPQAKAHVERSIGTFQRDFGPMLPGFIGHSVADRKVIEARRAFADRLGDNAPEKAFCVELTGAELQVYCDSWASDRYQHRPHAGLGRETPFQFAAAYAGTIRRIESERSLDILLAPIAGSDGIRTVGKQGVRVAKSLYLAPGIMPDTQVLVRMDPADMGRAWLFSLEGDAFLGEAICPELLGVDPVEAVKRAKEAQKVFMVEQTAEIRRLSRQIKPRDFVETILGQDRERAGNLVAFPRPSTLHTTPSIEAAASIDRDPQPSVSAWTPPASRAAEFASLQAEIEADLAGQSAAPTNVEPLRRFETPQLRFRRALALLERVEAGEAIPTEDALWLGGYRAGSEFSALSDAYADFGEAALK